MWVKSPLEKKQQQDPEWVTELACFLNKNNNTEKFMTAKKIFVDTYFENIREGMHPRVALQKAKMVSECFLMTQQRWKN